MSTHTLDQLDEALRASIDYVAVDRSSGHATKATGYAAIGLEAVRAAAARTVARHVLLVAIGGITRDRSRSVLDAGAQSVAVISDLLTTGDPTARVRDFLD